MMNIDEKYTVYVHETNLVAPERYPIFGSPSYLFQVFTRTKTMSPLNFCRLKSLGQRLKFIGGMQWDAAGNFILW
jgi:hypothetical protein